MAATVGERRMGFREEMHWRLSGKARIDRWVLSGGRALHMTLSGFLLSIALTWQGVVLIPGGPEPVAPFTDVLIRAAPLGLWGFMALSMGQAQFWGTALAWLGYVAPVRWARITTSAFACFYFTAVGVALLCGGYSFGPAMYLMVAVPMSVRDLNESVRMK